MKTVRGLSLHEAEKMTDPVERACLRVEQGLPPLWMSPWFQGDSDGRVETLIHEQGFPLGLVFGAVSLVDFATDLCYKMARMRSADQR